MINIIKLIGRCVCVCSKTNFHKSSYAGTSSKSLHSGDAGYWEREVAVVPYSKCMWSKWLKMATELESAVFGYTFGERWYSVTRTKSHLTSGPSPWGSILTFVQVKKHSMTTEETQWHSWDILIVQEHSAYILFIQNGNLTPCNVSCLDPEWPTS